MQLKQKQIVLYRRRNCQLISKKRGSAMRNETCKGEKKRNELGRGGEREGVSVLKLTEGEKLSDSILPRKVKLHNRGN